jgi:hypothetical protein
MSNLEIILFLILFTLTGFMIGTEERRKDEEVSRTKKVQRKTTGK